MCGRFTNKLTWEDIVRLYRLMLNAPPHNLRPRYNVCPTDTMDTIVFEQGVRGLVPMRWGLVPRWWSKTLKEIKLAAFNARAETVATKPFFRDAFRRTRYLISRFRLLRMAGYAGRQATVVFHGRDGSSALTVAGLWDEWKNPAKGEPLKSCTMIVTEPNEFIAEVHDRMPVPFEERQFEPWLRGEAGLEYLKPPPNDFWQKWPVSKRVNSSRADADDATLIQKVELAVA
jgi:putative SOS response-associated peptidase YedK